MIALRHAKARKSSILGSWWATWSHGLQTSSHAGLLGIPGLLEPKGWGVLVREAIACCEGLVGDVQRTKPSAETIWYMDEISNEVCKVMDAAEFCRNAHSDPQWRAAATVAVQKLHDYIQVLNTHRGLYSQLDAALQHYDRATAAAGLTEEERQQYSKEVVAVGRSLRDDMQRFGVHLCGDRQERFARLVGMEQELRFSFQRNLSEGERQQRMWPAGRHPNERVLLQLMEARHEIACTMGFASWSHFQLRDRSLAGDPTAVSSFLYMVSDSIQASVTQEAALMARFLPEARRRLPQAGSDAFPPVHDPIRPEQRRSCISLARQQSCPDLQLVRQYLTVEGCITALTAWVGASMGLRLEERELQPEEGWARHLKKLAVVDVGDSRGRAPPGRAGPDLGYMYLDLYSRPGKVAMNAQFTIRGRKQLLAGGMQKPVVVLMCNYAEPEGEQGAGASMTLHDWCMLFHEGGHALHALLGRTQLQHLAGTRGSLDIVEIPSHLLETLASHPDILHTFAAHRATREPIPERLLQQVLRGHHMFSSSTWAQSLFWALADLSLFGSFPPSSHREAVSKLAELSDVVSPTAPLFTRDGCQDHLYHTHFLGYGGCYYAYSYAKCFASAIAKRLFEEDLYCREGGRRVRDGLLAPGGAKDPRKYVTDLLGPKSLTSMAAGWAPSQATLMEALTSHPS